MISQRENLSTAEICESLGIKYYVNTHVTDGGATSHTSVDANSNNSDDPSIWFPSPSNPNNGLSLGTFSDLGLTGNDQELANQFYAGEEKQWDAPLGRFVSDVGSILYDYEHHRQNEATPRYMTNPESDGNERFSVLGAENEPLTADKCSAFIKKLREDIKQADAQKLEGQDHSEKNETQRVIESLGSQCLLALSPKSGGEILVFGDDLGADEAIKMISPWVESVESGETLKATTNEIIVHTSNPEKWVNLGAGYDASVDGPSAGFQRHTVHLPNKQ